MRNCNVTRKADTTIRTVNNWQDYIGVLRSNINRWIGIIIRHYSNSIAGDNPQVAVHLKFSHIITCCVVGGAYLFNYYA